MSATIFEKQGTTLTVKPEGRLDSVTSPTLEEELKQHLDGVENMTMDFAKLEYISSAGLRVLLESEKTLEERGGGLRLIHVNARILEVLQLVGFMEIVTVEES